MVKTEHNPPFSGGFFSGERFKKHEIDHRFGGHFRIFLLCRWSFERQFLFFFKRSPLKNPPQVINFVAQYLHAVSAHRPVEHVKIS